MNDIPSSSNGNHAPALRVMVVDDAAERAGVVQWALRRAGHEVIAHVASTFDLHRRVIELKPDVIIIDTESPDRDTLENLSLVNRDAPRPVVMFTNDGDNRKIREAVRAGVSAYVVDGLAADRVRPIIDVAVARFEQFQALRRELEETEGKLADRKLIERAKGILMKSAKLGEEEAYRALRKQAMDRNLQLVEVARQVVAVSELLG
ncbi:MAG: ANTAR domain-containing protein [Betaproteobacteria bacterium]|nr:ANTAR domain-containing protein [Betaproteobacteria bacterium]